jgi:hypothetical protein
MEEKDFLSKMENLKKPEVNPNASRRQIKLVMMNTRKSAAWGIWFLIVPVLFFGCITIKYLFQWDWGVGNGFIEWLARIDHQTATGWVSPVLFVLLPAIGAVMNLLAIIHFVYDSAAKELIVTLKIKWLNIILAVVSLAIIAVVFLYVIVENSAERAIKKYDIEWRSK